MVSRGAGPKDCGSSQRATAGNESAWWAQGRSPRGRGSPLRAVGEEADQGSIPAWAGEPLYNSGVKSRLWVDPRVGGGAFHQHSIHAGFGGRSPRWAGEPALAIWRLSARRVDPRVGGGAGADEVETPEM